MAAGIRPPYDHVGLGAGQKRLEHDTILLMPDSSFYSIYIRISVKQLAGILRTMAEGNWQATREHGVPGAGEQAWSQLGPEPCSAVRGTQDQGRPGRLREASAPDTSRPAGLEAAPRLDGPVLSLPVVHPACQFTTVILVLKVGEVDVPRQPLIVGPLGDDEGRLRIATGIRREHCYPHWPPVMGAPTSRIRPLLLGRCPTTLAVSRSSTAHRSENDSPRHLIQSYSNKARVSGRPSTISFRQRASGGHATPGGGHLVERIEGRAPQE